MRADALGKRSLEQAVANERALLVVIANAGDAGSRPGSELAARAGLPERTARAALARLIDRGMVGRDGKRRVWATVAGQKEARIWHHTLTPEQRRQPPKHAQGEATSDRTTQRPGPTRLSDVLPDLLSAAFPRSRPPEPAQARPALEHSPPRTPTAGGQCPACDLIYRPNPYYAMPATCERCGVRLEPLG